MCVCVCVIDVSEVYVWLNVLLTLLIWFSSRSASNVIGSICAQTVLRAVLAMALWWGWWDAGNRDRVNFYKNCTYLPHKSTYVHCLNFPSCTRDRPWINWFVTVTYTCVAPPRRLQDKEKEREGRTIQKETYQYELNDTWHPCCTSWSILTWSLMPHHLHAAAVARHQWWLIARQGGVVEGVLATRIRPGVTLIAVDGTRCSIKHTIYRLLSHSLNDLSLLFFARINFYLHKRA